VGQRAVRLLAREGAAVRAASRSLSRAQAACDLVAAKVPGAKLTAHAWSSDAEIEAALDGAAVVIAAGAASVELLSEPARLAARGLKVAIDLNAVPPAGLAGVDCMDRGTDRHGVACYGAIGVGGTKMKLHKAAIARLFETNDQLLDAEEIFELGRTL
jgi:hypothetical protein